MKAKAIEALMIELIKKNPDIHYVKSEAKKAGISVSADNLVDLMVEVLKLSESGRAGKKHEKEMSQ